MFFHFKPDTIQHRFTLKKDEKLKSRKRIQQLFKEGKSVSHLPFRVLYMESDEDHLRVAFSVSVKNFKKATDRNRIKRLMREAFRQQKIHLQDKLVEFQKSIDVFIIYTGNTLPAYEYIFKKMNFVLNHLKKSIKNY